MSREIAMKVGEKRHGEIDHLQASGNNTSAPAEAGEPVALPAVVIFNAIGFRFGLDQLMGRNQFGIATQMIGIVDGYLHLTQSRQ